MLKTAGDDRAGRRRCWCWPCRSSTPRSWCSSGSSTAAPPWARGPQPLLPPVHAHRLLAAAHGRLPAPVGADDGRLRDAGALRAAAPARRLGPRATRCSLDRRRPARDRRRRSGWSTRSRSSRPATCRRSASGASRRTSREDEREGGGRGGCRRAEPSRLSAGYAARQREPQQVGRVAPRRGVERARAACARSAIASGSREQPQPSLAHEQLVDAAQRALEHRPHGRAEHGRLAVHRAAGGDEHVGERDEAAAVDGRARARPRARGRARATSARCSVGARRARRSARAGRRAARRSTRGQQRGLRAAEVERVRRRGAHDAQHLRRRSTPSCVEHAAVGLEVRQVVLLLEARVADQLGGRGRRSGRAARAGSRRAPARACASRQLTWCWSAAHS